MICVWKVMVSWWFLWCPFVLVCLDGACVLCAWCIRLWDGSTCCSGFLFFLVLMLIWYSLHSGAFGEQDPGMPVQYQAFNWTVCSQKRWNQLTCAYTEIKYSSVPGPGSKGQSHQMHSIQIDLVSIPQVHSKWLPASATCALLVLVCGDWSSEDFQRCAQQT